MNKIFGWPVICVLCLAVIAIGHFQISNDTTHRQGYWFGLASYAALSTTYIVIAALERFKGKIFRGGKLTQYRFWLFSCFAGVLIWWLIFSIFQIPVWRLSSLVLTGSYTAMLFGSLFIAWLISPNTKSPLNK